MKRNIFLYIIIVIAGYIWMPHHTQAQTNQSQVCNFNGACGLSDIEYDDQTDTVYGESSTTLDDYTATLYSPYVEGGIYDNPYDPLDFGTDSPGGTIALVETQASVVEGWTYYVQSKHELISLTQVPVQDCGDPTKDSDDPLYMDDGGDNGGGCSTDWDFYDPLGFSSLDFDSTYGYGPGLFIEPFLSGGIPTTRGSSNIGLGNTTSYAVAVKLRILQDGNDVTNQTQNAIVGQQINLSLTVQPTSTSTTNNQWTIPGKVIKNYDLTQATNQVTSLSSQDFQGQQITYYWLDGSDGRSVQFSCMVNNRVIQPKQTTFNVKRPTATVTVTSYNNIAADKAIPSVVSDWGLHYGIDPAVNVGNPGITFTQPSITMPSGFAPGTVEFVQIINSMSGSRTITLTGQVETISGTGMLDNHTPYGNAFTTDNPSNGVLDAPSTALIYGYSTDSISQSFVMYLLFKPAGAGSIFVPLIKMPWSWSGHAIYDGTDQQNQHWSLVPADCKHSEGSVSDTTDPPQWTQIAIAGHNPSWN